MMTDEQFEARLTHIEDQVAAMQERLDGYRDQQLAKLFIESGWSQEQLAAFLTKKWGKSISREHLSDRLRFGRFLSFFGASCTEDQWKIPPNLTEGTFRRFWESTEASGDFSGHRANTKAAIEDERRRFRSVAVELEKAGIGLHKQPLRDNLIKAMAGKPPATAEEILARMARLCKRKPTLEHIVRSLRGFKPKPGSPYRMEKWRSAKGDATRYRLIKCKGKVLPPATVARLAPELLPLIDDILAEAGKPAVEISHAAICNLAARLRALMLTVVGEVSREA
jgi:hypothetical protein